MSSNGVINLSSIPPGRQVEIVSIGGGPMARRRIMSMGLHPGDIVIVEINNFRGPILVRHVVLGTRIALGRGMARWIQVKGV